MMSTDNSPDLPRTESTGQVVEQGQSTRTGPSEPRLDWRQKLFDKITSRESYIFVIVMLGMIFVYIFARGNSLQGIWTVEYARGLITLTFSVGTMVIAVVLILTAVLRDPNDDEVRAEARFDRAKEVLTLLIGIFGTIVGFYFGSLHDGRQAQPTNSAIAALGGDFRGDAAYLTGPVFTNDNIALIRESPAFTRLYLEDTNVTAEGLLKLKGIVGLKAIYLIGADQNKKIDAPSIANLRNELTTISLHPIP
jgi:hypothetical protein